MARPTDVEDLYDLSPFQHGVLFHILYAPGAGVYFEQLVFTLEGALRADAFRQAWDHVIERHSILRTTFHWKELAKPMQVVRKEVRAVVEEQDWRSLGPDEQSFRLAEYLAADRRRGFDLTEAPLFRMTLLRVADDRYKFIWRFPHILLDGWSFGLALAEFLDAYRSTYHGRAPAITAAPKFRDYIAWSKRLPLEAHEAFWRRTLRGFTRPNAIEVGSRPAISGQEPFSHDRVEIDLTDRLPALQAFARSNRVTLNTLVQGAFMLLVSRYSGDEDVLVGATMAGRESSLPDAERTMGPMIVSVPIRVRVDPLQSVASYLHAVQTTLVAAREHQQVPLVELHKWSEVRPGQGLFESVVAFENVPLPSVDLRDVDLRLVDSLYDGRPQYPLTLVIFPGDELVIRLIFDRRRYRAPIASAILDHLSAVLASFVANVEGKVGDVDWLGADRQRIVGEWNATARAYPREPSMHRSFEVHALERPGAVALAWEDRTMTYGELDARAEHVARDLRRRGVGPQSPVAILTDRSPEMVIGMLGILKAGAAYVPVDPSYPAKRRKQMTASADTRWAVTQSHCMSAVPEGVQPVVIHADGPIDRSAPTPLRASMESRSMSSIIFTSGSTGSPKGVMSTHGALSNRLQWMQEYFRLGTDDRVLQKTPFTFDVSVWEIFWPLRVGATLVLARPEGHRDAGYLADLIERARITTVHFVPSMLQAFLGEPELARRCVALRRTICSGEALSKALEQRYYDQLAAPLFNLYGPTEAAIDVSFWACNLEAETTVPIGRPIANTQLYVLDAAMRPVPVGVAGELFIGGVALALGYVGQPELTAEKFGPSPFDPEGRSRLYRTGDRVRLREDGAIEYVDRLDNQIKLRGFRIELGEIEAALRSVSGIRDAAVAAQEVARDDRRLVAYVVAEGDPIPPETLRRELADRLPEYMVPSIFVPLAALPLGTNGKLDRKALPAPSLESTMRREAYVPPETDTQIALADIARGLLGVERIGLYDNLLDLGLHSLHATAVVKAVRDQLHVDLPLRALFDRPTVAGLAEVVDREESWELGSSSDDVDYDRESVLEASLVLDRTGEIGSEAKVVLLTGATGFLGTFLLRELLESTTATIKCLGRGRKDDEVRERIAGRLRGWGLWRDSFAARIDVVRGDLAQIRFGLGEAAFDSIAEEADAIYHCGALVNFLMPYARVRDANVHGTREAVRLALRGRPKPLHYVSTVGVFAPRALQTAAVPESAPPDDPRDLASGYAQSKAVAERLVCAARDRGLPVTIYRPGRITGSSRTGHWETTDLVCQMMKACARLGVVPDLDVEFDMVPVDYVSAAIVAIAKRPDAVGKVFHVTNPRRVSFNALHEFIEKKRYVGKRIEFGEWYETLGRYTQADSSREFLPLVMLMSRIVETTLKNRAEPKYDCANTLRFLEDTPLRCPPIGADITAVYVDYLTSIGFLD